MTKDLVCGMEIDEIATAYKSIQSNNVYYFCSANCQKEFNKDPIRYLRDSAATHKVSHYGGYCPTPGCSKPQRGLAWYLYVGLLIILLLALLLYVL